jgi:stage IV sporulation protein FA
MRMRMLAKSGANNGGGPERDPFPGQRDGRRPDVRPLPDERKPLDIRPLPDMRDDRWLDPEFVWKQRQRMLEGGGPDGDDPPLGRSIRFFAIRLALSAALFAALWLIYRSDAPWAVRVQHTVSAALETPFDFQAVEAWYGRHFAGFPSFIPAWQGEREPSEKVNADPSGAWRKPVEGRVVQAFSPTSPGVLLDVPAAATAVAIDTGRVLFVGETNQTGLTVIIQHAGGLNTMYGRLAVTTLEKDDWLEAGEPVGIASASAGAGGRIYFAMKRGDEYLDPAAVFRFE